MVSGNTEATAELLNSPGINIEARDEQQLTPLHMACTYGQEGCVRILIGAGANLASRDEKQQDCLHKAAQVYYIQLTKGEE